MGHSLARRLFLWCVFVALVAALPPITNGLISFLRGETTSLTALLSEGDGFLVAVAITADAIARAFNAIYEKKSVGFAATMAILCGLVLVLGLFCFGYTSTDRIRYKNDIHEAEVRTQKSIDSSEQSLAKADLVSRDDLKKAINGSTELVAALEPPNRVVHEWNVAIASEIFVGLSIITSFIVVMRL